jgi:hypothetical protein
MTKIAFLITAAGLIALPGCNASPGEEAVGQAADNAIAEIENSADALDAAAENTTDQAVAATLENAADDAEAAAENVAEIADNAL